MYYSFLLVLYSKNNFCCCINLYHFNLKYNNALFCSKRSLHSRITFMFKIKPWKTCCLSKISCYLQSCMILFCHMSCLILLFCLLDFNSYVIQDLKLAYEILTASNETSPESKEPKLYSKKDAEIVILFHLKGLCHLGILPSFVRYICIFYRKVFMKKLNNFHVTTFREQTEIIFIPKSFYKQNAIKQ